MAHIFKYPTESNKGIIVFTHKEWPGLLETAFPTLQDLKKYFFLGWNQGIYFGNIQMPPIVDFAFTSPNAITFPDNGNTQNIELLDRNFILDDFKDLNIKDKTFDIITVSRVAKWKNVPSLLHAIRELNDKKIYPNCLLVMPTSLHETSENADVDIVRLYEKLFNVEERKNITMLRLSDELGYLGVSPKTINWFYNNSKILYIGSDSEGGCRVVHEALLTGCDVVYFKDHKGPLKDYLDDTNSISFESYDKVSVALEKAINNYKYFKDKGKKYDELLSERFSLKKLIPHFEKLYERHNQVFDGKLINCDNLSNRLPAHYGDVDWKNPEGHYTLTAHIKTMEQFHKFIEHINKNI